MKVIVCLDERRGMMFNKRRCSRDRAVIEDILTMYTPADLCVSTYSASLFEGACVIGITLPVSGAVHYERLVGYFKISVCIFGKQFSVVGLCFQISLVLSDKTLFQLICP